VLAHAIVAQRITLSPAPTMAPSSLTGHGYFFMGPLHDTWVAVVASVQALAAAAAAQLRRPTDAGGAALAAEVRGRGPVGWSVPVLKSAGSALGPFPIEIQ
jgi:hypothetical protein